MFPLWTHWVRAFLAKSCQFENPVNSWEKYHLNCLNIQGNVKDGMLRSLHSWQVKKHLFIIKSPLFNHPNSKLVLPEIWRYLQRNTASIPHKYLWIRNMIIGMMIFSILPFSEVKFDLRFQRYAILKYESICREIQCWNLTNTCELEIISTWWWLWAVCFWQNLISSFQFKVSPIRNMGISPEKYSVSSSQILVN